MVNAYLSAPDTLEGRIDQSLMLWAAFLPMSVGFRHRRMPVVRAMILVARMTVVLRLRGHRFHG